MDLIPTKYCRLSGEDLHNADLLFELKSCPLPGIYPDDAERSVLLRTPLKVVQAKKSGFTQLAHTFDSGNYSEYAFAGGGAKAYRIHLDWFADRIAHQYPASASILEVGCGDGYLLDRLISSGFEDVIGIDPSRAAESSPNEHLVRGFFPDDLPSSHAGKKYDLIVCRHVLEHIESPLAMIQTMAERLTPDGQIWIEVPDLDAAVKKNLWSNFYQLHCNYFNSQSLDTLAAHASLVCHDAQNVEIFGGSILRCYVRAGKCPLEVIPRLLPVVPAAICEYQSKLHQLAASLPAGTAGYGAAERTALILGMAPSLEQVITTIYDGNPLLDARYLAGTRIRIKEKKALFETRVPALVLFALSNSREILSEWKQKLGPDQLVAMAGEEFTLKPLNQY